MGEGPLGAVVGEWTVLGSPWELRWGDWEGSKGCQSPKVAGALKGALSQRKSPRVRALREVHPRASAALPGSSPERDLWGLRVAPEPSRQHRGHLEAS